MARKKQITKMQSNVRKRGMLEGVIVREIDKESRTAVFVAATENGVDVWGEKEYLRISGMDSTRFKKNPVILDTHDRYTTKAIVGRGKIRVEKKQLIVEVEFAETEEAERVWLLVSTGFLKTLSVGFIPNETQVLSEGETDGRGANKIEGPARIMKEWELVEISVVPVPADEDALIRRGLNDMDDAQMRDVFGMFVNTVLRRYRSMRPEDEMEDQSGVEDTKDSARGKNDETPGEHGNTPAPGKEGNEGGEDKPKAEGEPEDKNEEQESDRARSIRDITPRGLGFVAEKCIIDGVGIEEARKRLNEEYAKRHTPAGTPEPERVSTGGKKADGEKEGIDDVDDEVLARSF